MHAHGELTVTRNLMRTTIDYKALGVTVLRELLARANECAKLILR